MEAIYNIAEICAKKNVNNVILSPGSRCAPLTIAFARHPKIKEKTFSDERSAAFVALGMAQYTEETVALLCTSGTASLNYAPAITEAYYQHVPLLVLTADRPPEWIDQRDGQTIRQTNIYQNHIKGSYDLPVDYAHEDSQWQINRILSEAINLSQEDPKGPVHINIPLREPFYPSEEIVFDQNVKVIEKLKATAKLDASVWKKLQQEANRYENILLVAGQEQNNQLRSILLNAQEIPIISDCISNVQSENSIYLHDIIFSRNNAKNHKKLKPDLLITYGKSVISKNIKLFIRANKPITHWHIQEVGEVADTYQSLTKIIPVSINEFTQNIALKSNEYLKKWKEEEAKASIYQETFFKKAAFGEFKAIHQVLEKIPVKSNLHLANSMTVRYANFFPNTKKLHVFANRGTSGIDGSTSTTVGTALVSEKMNTLITGDLSFFYDRNAFWNNYIPSNLRIIVLNNHGGGIFRMIEGPTKQEELEPYFITKQTLRVKNTAKDFNLAYQFCTNENEVNNALSTFFEKSKTAKILEIESNTEINTEIFKNFKSYGI